MNHGATHQSHKTAQLRLFEIVQLSIQTIFLANMRPLPLLVHLIVQCKSIAVQLLGAKMENTQVRGIKVLS